MDWCCDDDYYDGCDDANDLMLFWFALSTLLCSALSNNIWNEIQIQIYNGKGSTEEMKDKAKQALKVICFMKKKS